MIIDQNIIDEIEDKLLLIEENPHTDLASLVRTTLEQDSLAHSRLLEEEGKTRKEKRTKRQEKRTTLNGLYDAWRYASMNFRGGLTDELITKTAELIDPSKNKGEYRTENLGLMASDPVLPLRPEKIRRDMDTLLRYSNDSEELHAVERAALVHLHLARIHPFLDGNGRTARLLQNVILQSEGYAPATVKLEERDFYLSLLRQAMRGYKKREGETSFEEVWTSPLKISDSEVNFYNFIGSKVNIELEQQLQGIEKLPSYTITLSGRKIDPGYVITAKRLLQNYFRANEVVGQTRVKNRKGILEVKGDINEQIIGRVLSQKYDGNFKITRQNK